MAKFVDGYVLPLPKKNLAAYRRIAAQCGKIWRGHGALEFLRLDFAQQDDVAAIGAIDFFAAIAAVDVANDQLALPPTRARRPSYELRPMLRSLGNPRICIPPFRRRGGRGRSGRCGRHHSLSILIGGWRGGRQGVETLAQFAENRITDGS